MNDQQPQHPSSWDILVLHETDNTAVALKPLAQGDEIFVRGAGIKVSSMIPAGHKIALEDIPAGANVIKYGEIIGIAITGIQRGEHVHVQNLVGKRVGQELSK